MLKTIHTIILALAALLLAWLLPWSYAFVFASPRQASFTLYSCVTRSFASLDWDGQGKFMGRDFRGNTYTQREFDSILPIFYCRQLAAEGRFPACIEGEPVELRTVAQSKFTFRSAPSRINRRIPALYPLLESMSGRVDLQPPGDVFRITDRGIEFVDMETNTVDRIKSEVFTRVMKQKGFEFPARVVAGNPTTRKEYDNGYLLVDDACRVFHLKQMRGRPFVRLTDVPAEAGIEHAFVTEFADRRLLGLLADRENRFYALDAKDYSLHELPMGPFDPADDDLRIVGDMFYWTVVVDGAAGERVAAVNPRDWSLADVHVEEPKSSAWERCAEWIFPFSLSFTSSADSYVRPRLADFSAHALWLGLLLAVGYLMCGNSSGRRWLRAAGIVLFGLFLFIPLVVFNPRR